MKSSFGSIRQIFRILLRQVAQWLNNASSGRLTPNAITVFGLLMHLPITIMIARGRFFLAAVLLFLFGLLDILGGELVRLRKNENTNISRLINAAADRFKEVILYAGAAFFLAGGQHPRAAVWAVVACGAALSASYIKLKKETMENSHEENTPYVRLIFTDGVLSLQIRLFVLFIGLVTGQLLLAVAGIAILASISAIQRLAGIVSKFA